MNSAILRISWVVLLLCGALLSPEIFPAQATGSPLTYSIEPAPNSPVETTVLSGPASLSFFPPSPDGESDSALQSPAKSMSSHGHNSWDFEGELKSIFELANPLQSQRSPRGGFDLLFTHPSFWSEGTVQLASFSPPLNFWGNHRAPAQDHGGSAHTTPLSTWRYEKLFVDFQQSANAIVPNESPYGQIDLILHPTVEQSLRYFQTVIPDRFQEWLTRFNRYKPAVEQIFQELGLPKELIYLSLVESGFNPRAYSRARAAGPWQFMKATGRLYGLSVSWYIDERRDPIRSTVAAARHLRDLYDRFGSWPLALAAYNAGSGKISRAIKRSGSRDYWKIRKTRYIRRETKNYVPRFMAATIIASNPTLFGFSPGVDDPHRYHEVLFKKKVHLRGVAEETGITFEELRRLNPELRRSIIPQLKKGYYLKVPYGMEEQVAQVQDQIQPWNQPEPRGQDWYRVRRGDSLSVIARRFRMKVSTLKRFNNLSGNLIRVGMRLRVSEEMVPTTDTQGYRIQEGDSLSLIAKKFGMSVQQLKRLNNLSGNLIRVGAKLQVHKQAKISKDPKWYRVRNGDSLWSIAQRFRVTVTDLKDLNNLTASVIRAGHMLMVSR
jgi:membrane-bound lytic murein transglycosylase D